MTSQVCRTPQPEDGGGSITTKSHTPTTRWPGRIWDLAWILQQAVTHRDHLASLQGELWGEAVGNRGIIPILPLDLPVPHRLVL